MTTSKLEEFLNQFSEKDWLAAIERLLPEIHEVDRNAVQIWSRFYPLEFYRYMQTVEDREEAIRKFVLQGDWELKNQIDTSHRFLYGHRFWKEVKAEIEQRAATFGGETQELSTVIEEVALAAATKAKTSKSLTLAIAAVGLMTLVQAGLEGFRQAKGEVTPPAGRLTLPPDEIVKQRLRDDSQGLLGFLKTVDKKFTVTYDETARDSRFQIINEEEIASAAARDQSKDWRAIDPRCIEGVIPVECRSASCGTCWIGVLDGEEKLSEVTRRERRQMKVFGYNQPEDDRPFMRLACQARATGNVSIVIPPWNGVFGKKVYGNLEDVDLEPVTTAAKKLRDTVASVVGGSQ